VTGRDPQPVVVALAADTGVVTTVERLCDAGRPPASVLVGSRSARLIVRFTRHRSGTSVAGIGRAQASGRAPTAALDALAARHGFAVKPFPVDGAGTIVLELARQPGRLCLLPFCRTVDRAIVESAGSGCIGTREIPLPLAPGPSRTRGGAHRSDRAIEVSAWFVDVRAGCDGPVVSRAIVRAPAESSHAFRERVAQAHALVLADAALQVIERRRGGIFASLSASVLGALHGVQAWIGHGAARELDAPLVALASLGMG
jgi:hypothetical protein